MLLLQATRFPILSTLLLLLLLSTLTSASTNQEICKKKNPRVVTAIEMFCKHTSSLTVPSISAKKGIHFTPSGTQSPNDLYLDIQGTCSPPQWVPQQYCRTQFFSICAKGGARGGGEMKYGRNSCQKWRIRIEKPKGIVIVPVTPEPPPLRGGTGRD